MALTSIFTQQQRHLLILDEYDDPTLAHEMDNVELINTFCDAMIKRFEKIKKAISDNTEKGCKRAIGYAEDGQ